MLDKKINKRRLLNWCKRYSSMTLLALGVVSCYLLFFNEYSISRTHEQEREIDDLERRITQAQDTLDYYRALNRRLDTDPATMERIVREQYHMQRPDEDVYLFE